MIASGASTTLTGIVFNAPQTLFSPSEIVPDGLRTASNVLKILQIVMRMAPNAFRMTLDAMRMT